MSDEQLTNEQLDEHIAALWFSAPASKAYKVARDLKIERAKVDRLEAIITGQDRTIGDERRAHEVEIAALTEGRITLVDGDKKYRRPGIDENLYRHFNATDGSDD